MPVKQIRQAINETLFQEMKNDDRVILMGEDISGGEGAPGDQDAWGGVFAVTKGLQPEFGPERVKDTPISETAFVGVGVGAAAAGLRPVVELMFCDFAGVCLDQIANQAAKLRYMSDGQVSMPLTIRTSYGGAPGAGAAAQHSQTWYSIFAHVPGLKVVVPSNAYDAKGLLTTSIRDDNPVVFFEHKHMYDLTAEVPDESYEIPFGEARIAREGSDVTLVAIGGMVHIALQAAKKLDKEGISCEVIDPRTIVPFDMDTVLASLEKTGKLVIVDEASPRCSFASDLAGQVADVGFSLLKAPVKLVTAPNVPVPFAPVLEALYIPDAGNVMDKVKEIT